MDFNLRIHLIISGRKYFKDVKYKFFKKFIKEELISKDDYYDKEFSYYFKNPGGNWKKSIKFIK